MVGPVKAVLRALRYLWTQEFALRRVGGRWRLVAVRALAPGEVEPPDPGWLAARREQAQLEAMRSELAALLETLPDAGTQVRHLGFFQSVFERGGLSALDDVPLDVLERALAQFEAAVTNWSGEGLARLRSKMAVAVAERRLRLGDSGDEPADGVAPPASVRHSA